MVYANQALADLFGYRVLTAKDGRDGLAVLNSQPEIDLVLSDVVLGGGMSGPDFAIEAKRQIGDLKVLFMSGYAKGVALNQSRLPEDAAILNKPFRRRELAEKVRTALNS